MTFTLSGNGGPTGADNGGFYPSTAYGRLTSTSNGLSGSVINIADLGESPQDGFTEYQGYPRSYPTSLGRLQLRRSTAMVGQYLLRYQLHPVPELRRGCLYPDARDLRRNQGWLRKLGDLS